LPGPQPRSTMCITEISAELCQPMPSEQRLIAGWQNPLAHRPGPQGARPSDSGFPQIPSHLPSSSKSVVGTWPCKQAGAAAGPRTPINPQKSPRKCRGLSSESMAGATGLTPLRSADGKGVMQSHRGGGFCRRPGQAGKCERCARASLPCPPARFSTSAQVLSRGLGHRESN